MIEALELARTFKTPDGDVQAVRGVSFHVEAGEIVGFLGPNGAGKTTSLRMLTTLLRPTSGTAMVAGCDLLRDPTGVRRRIGYVAQTGGTDPSAVVRDELILQGRLYRMSRADAEARARELSTQLDLGTLLPRMAGSLSGGQRRRLDIALGLVHRPALVFLDEPSTGLDPQSRNQLWSHIRRLRDELQTTVFLTTHYLDEADALCDRILIVDDGRIVAEDSPDRLKDRVSGDVVTVHVNGSVEQARAALAALPGVQEISVHEQTVRLVIEHTGRLMFALTRALDHARVDVGSIQVVRPSLDDVFLAITGHRPLAQAGRPAGPWMGA
ncbi:MAG TPA: ATP-binding cassette domain-containing protein [Rugosimonospora sp.]|nr:ATP-binding cassette domain-containing protein [Rugosimonospora sp.]